MTNRQAPERIWLYEGPDGRDWTECEVFGSPAYVPASALEAAQARIEELENRWVEDTGKLAVRGEHLEDAIEVARAKHYTECAAIADDWYHRSGHGSPGDDIRAKIDGKERGDG